MAAFFGILQTGHESRKTSQSLQEQRCRQGSITTHEFLVLQILHTVFFFVSVLSGSSQQDSASSAAFSDKNADSLRRWMESLSDAIMASFSLATLCHVRFSISIFFMKLCSSVVRFAALAISSSFCFSSKSLFHSYFVINTDICCFLCSCIAILNLSFCSISTNTFTYVN